MLPLKHTFNQLSHLNNRLKRQLLLGTLPVLLLLGVISSFPLFIGKTAEAETLTIANTPTEQATSQPKRVYQYFHVESASTAVKAAKTALKPTTANAAAKADEPAEWGWPYTGGQYVTSTFGKRDLADSPWHDGVDFNAGVGSKIHAVHAGKVIFVGNPMKRGVTDAYPLGLGKDVVVTETADGDQIVYQEFAMGKQTHTVKVGETVKVGQVIATQASGHLHLGVTNQKSWVTAQNDWQNPTAHSWQDPLKLIKAAD